MFSKEQLINSLKDLPEKFSIDELLDRIMLLHKLEVGLEQSEEGAIKTTEEAKAILGKWLR